MQVSGTTAEAERSSARDTPFENSLGMRFVPVPITGGPTNGQRVLFSLWETRVQDYASFLQATGRRYEPTYFQQAANHPIVKVNWSPTCAVGGETLALAIVRSLGKTALPSCDAMSVNQTLQSGPGAMP